MAFVPRIVKLLFKVYLHFTLIVHRAAHHPHAARSGQGAAPATGSTCDAATSTDDLNPVTIEIAESEHGITAVNVVEERNAAAPRERANTTLVRIVDELYTWVPVVACAALFYGHWRGDFDARLIGLRG